MTRIAPAEVVPVLIKLLQEDDEDVRSVAIDLLASLGSEAQEAIPAFTKLLQRKDGTVNPSIFHALKGRMGPEGRRHVIDALTVMIQDSDLQARMEAADYLGQLGIEGTIEAMPALTKLLQDQDSPRRPEVVIALRNTGPEGRRRSIPALIQLLQSKDGPVCSKAGWMLASMGPAAKEAIPTLTQLLRNKDAHVRGMAFSVLTASMGPEGRKPAIAALIELLQHDDQDVRMDAILQAGESESHRGDACAD